MWAASGQFRNAESASYDRSVTSVVLIVPGQDTYAVRLVELLEQCILGRYRHMWLPR